MHAFPETPFSLIRHRRIHRNGIGDNGNDTVITEGGGDRMTATRTRATLSIRGKKRTSGEDVDEEGEEERGGSRGR